MCISFAGLLLSPRLATKGAYIALEKLWKSHENILERREEAAIKQEKAPKSNAKKAMRPALTPEARENQMIALAMDLAEQQLRDGTASSQLITEFVKRGAAKARLEKEKLEEENKLLRAKTEAIQSQKRVEELYAEAIKAMRDYSGTRGSNEDSDLP